MGWEQKGVGVFYIKHKQHRPRLNKRNGQARGLARFSLACQSTHPFLFAVVCLAFINAVQT